MHHLHMLLDDAKLIVVQRIQLTFEDELLFNRRNQVPKLADCAEQRLGQDDFSAIRPRNGKIVSPECVKHHFALHDGLIDQHGQGFTDLILQESRN
ncbi:hypothetical protein D3C73_1134750 [compost metagenome]